MENNLNKIKKEVLNKLSEVKDSKVLREIETKYFSRKGVLSTILRDLKNLETGARKKVGQLANSVKKELQEKLKEVQEDIEGGLGDNGFNDMTLPGKKIKRGHLNPVTLIQGEIEDMFSSLGFVILDGPELESDYYNFEALNIPEHHPAREEQDTFYVNADKKKSNLVMRTHTSPVQIRAMQKYGAPFRGIAPGRVFRNEAIDASHEHTFCQLEGIMIDKDISITNLVAVMKELIKGVFKKDIDVRVRPGFFPFVEPGFELDIQCTICGGTGCSVCKQSGWLELFPAGMIHPDVLKAGGIDPNEYSGFAFGLGLTRLAMMKYGIGDIRLFNSGDLRFLEQF